MLPSPAACRTGIGACKTWLLQPGTHKEKDTQAVKYIYIAVLYACREKPTHARAVANSSDNPADRDMGITA